MSHTIVIGIVEFIACSHLLLFGIYLLLKKGLRPGVRWIGIFVFLLGVHFVFLATFSLVSNDLLDLMVDFFTSAVLFSYGPILLFANKIFAAKQVSRREILLHFSILLFPICVDLGVLPASIETWPSSTLSIFDISIYTHNLFYIGWSYILYSRKDNRETSSLVFYLNVGYSLMIFSFVGLLFDAQFNASQAYFLYKTFFLIVLIAMVDSMLVAALRNPKPLQVERAKYLSNANRNYLKRVLEKVCSDLEDSNLFSNGDLTLQDLSDRTGFNTSDVSLAINRLMGCTFKEYLNTLRVNKAWEVLHANPDMRINEIMYQSGYNSRSLFLKNFKEKYGKTPSEVRKEVLALETV